MYSSAKEWLPILTHHSWAALSLYSPLREVKEWGQHSQAQEEITQGATDKNEEGKQCYVATALRVWRADAAC